MAAKVRRQFETTPERRAQMEALVAFFEKQEAGAELSWLKVEHETGVPMDSAGRSMARRALGKVGFAHAAKPGYGLELSSAENGVVIMGNACSRIVGAVGRARKRHKKIMVRHGEEMTADQRAKMQAVESLLGGTTALASRATVRMLRE